MAYADSIRTENYTREELADLLDDLDTRMLAAETAVSCGNAGGTANAITLTSGLSLTGTPANGLTVFFRATAANTSSVTLALDSTGTIDLTRVDDAGAARALEADEILDEQMCMAVYNSNLGDWILTYMSPQAWLSWTPTRGGANGMSLTTSSTTEAGYRLVDQGLTVEFYGKFSFGVNASGGSGTLTMPVTSAAIGTEICIGVGQRITSGWNNRDHLIITEQGGNMFMEAEGGLAWSSSTTYTVGISGSYRLR